MPTIDRFTTQNGRRIYRVPVQSFPMLVTNLFVISDGAMLTLVDTGSGTAESNETLIAGIAAIGEQYGETVTLADINQVLITHGHIDHYGGLPFVRTHNQTAPVGVHILDQRVLSHHDERVVVASSRLRTFLGRAGVPQSKQARMMDVYLFSKGFYRSQPVQTLLKDGMHVAGDIVVHHVPGHCPGLVCLQIDDVLLTADHVLSKTTPHQAPESITLNTGLTHYFASLAKVAGLPGVAYGLGAHEARIDDVAARAAEIRAMHEARLSRVLEICRAPASVADVSRALFGDVRNYHVLLALEEAGAHVEYLYQRGMLVAANVDEIAADAGAVILYVTP